MEPRSRTRSHARYSLAKAVCTRSSAWCWSPVSRYAVRSSRPWRAWRYAVKSASRSVIAAPISATLTRPRRRWVPDGCNPRSGPGCEPQCDVLAVRDVRQGLGGALDRTVERQPDDRLSGALGRDAQEVLVVLPHGLLRLETRELTELVEHLAGAGVEHAEAPRASRAVTDLDAEDHRAVRAEVLEGPPLPLPQHRVMPAVDDGGGVRMTGELARDQVELLVDGPCLTEGPDRSGLAHEVDDQRPRARQRPG